MVEAHAAEKRASGLEDKLTGGPLQRPAGPVGLLGIAWWWWLVGFYFVYRNRAHLLSAITGREPRAVAVLRAIGWRTHRKGGDS
jgi:hypothetical protein